jgi:hypothetical protein
MLARGEAPIDGRCSTAKKKDSKQDESREFRESAEPSAMNEPATCRSLLACPQPKLPASTSFAATAA